MVAPYQPLRQTVPVVVVATGEADDRLGAPVRLQADGAVVEVEHPLGTRQAKVAKVGWLFLLLLNFS